MSYFAESKNVLNTMVDQKFEEMKEENKNIIESQIKDDKHIKRNEETDLYDLK
jgi:hypothetical protein